MTWFSPSSFPLPGKALREVCLTTTEGMMSNIVVATLPSSLRRVLCLSYGKHSIVLLLKTYLDDSGKSDDPSESITCIAGAIAPLQAWEDLEREWKEVLRQFNVPYLHMKEYAHSAPASPFEKWKGDEDTRRSFLSVLMDIMEPHVLGLIGTTVPNEDFRRLTSAQQQQMRNPFFMCFQQTILAAGVNAFAEFKRVGQSLEIPESNLPEGEKMEVVFSKQDEFRHISDAFHYAMQERMTIGPMLGSLSWASYKDVIPLQVADLVAYEVKRFAATLIDEKRNTIRTPMKRLLSMNPFFTFLRYNELVKRFYVSGPAFRS